MTLHTFAVFVEDTASEESMSFAIDASSALIACTRAAARLFGPAAEARQVYGCAACREELWEAEGLDSSGFRFCAACTPEDLESREPQEPIGLAVGTARIRAQALARLPGDAPLGALSVAVAGAPSCGFERGDAFEDDDAARAAMERALRTVLTLEDALGDLTLRDESGAYFHYRLRPVPAPVDAHDLAARGLIEPPDDGEH